MTDWHLRQISYLIKQVKRTKQLLDIKQKGERSRTQLILQRDLCSHVTRLYNC